MRDDRVGLSSFSNPVRNNVAQQTVFSVKDIEDRSLYALFTTEEKAMRYISQHSDGLMMYVDQEVVWG